MKKESVRESNFELLRIISMFLIIVFHIVVHSVNVQLNGVQTTSTLFNNPIIYKRLFILDVLSILGIVGNAIFILISGYFNVTKKEVNISKVASKLLSQLFFSFIILITFSFIYYGFIIKKNYWNITMYDSSLFNTMSWFIGYYFLIILSGKLFLNKFLNKISKKEYIEFLLILAALISLNFTGGFLDGITNSLRTVFTGVFLYSFGGFINKYKPFEKIKVSALFLSLIFIIIIVLVCSFNIKCMSIRNYFVNGSTEPFIQKISSFSNYNVLILLIGVIIFELFRRISIKNNKIINYISASTLMIYLFHDNQIFYELWSTVDWLELLHNNMLMFTLYILMWSCIMFILGSLVYIMYKLIIRIYDKHKYIFIKS